MPITITPAPPDGLAGWGLMLQLSSDFIGPLPLGSNFVVSWNVDSDRTQAIRRFTYPTANPFIDVTMGVGQQGSFTFTPGVALKDGDNVFIGATLNSPTAQEDSGNVTAIWSNTAGLHTDIANQLAASDAAGFTATDRAKLTTTLNNTSTTIVTPTGTIAASIGELLGVRSISTLTEVEITAGPQSGFVAQDLAVWVQAIIVRIATVAPIDIALTADDGWFPRALAVVNVFHGSDLYQRVSVHTISRVIQVGPSDLHSFAIQALETDVWPESVSVQVTFASGVTGQVFKAILP